MENHKAFKKLYIIFLWCIVAKDAYQEKTDNLQTEAMIMDSLIAVIEQICDRAEEIMLADFRNTNTPGVILGYGDFR
ncbi:MAG: hypothetical protein ACLT2Z_09925 [Eubacterium sp.]